MKSYQSFDPALLDAAGLNRQAVFDLDALPADVGATVRASAGAAGARQLILIGHAGRRLWQAMRAAGTDGPDPVDRFSERTVRHWLAESAPHTRYTLLYPGATALGLQRLGQLAGWHHAAPFMVGIDREWGSWFAYRAVVLADSAFEPSRPLATPHPCHGCAQRVCIASCPAGALDGGRFDFDRCAGYRKLADSQCAHGCPARVSCPLGSAHRYDEEQMRHIYGLSLQAIRQYY